MFDALYHYVWPTHSTDISMMHFISVIQDVLLSTFKRTHYGFSPGIYLPDFKEQFQEEFLQKEYRADGPVN